LKTAVRLLGGLTALTVVFGVATTPAQASPQRAETWVASTVDAVPGIAPSDADAIAVYRDSAGRTIAAPSSPRTLAAPLIGCTPESGHDNPHRSGTGIAVSGHGWWKKGTCSNDRAKVTNCLYEWYTDYSWRLKKCSETKELRPYTGSGQRTVARRDCDDTNMTSWRNHVDVDVLGEIDSGEKPYRQANVACRVY